jgi:hypothetical protein
VDWRRRDSHRVGHVPFRIEHLPDVCGVRQSERLTRMTVSSGSGSVAYQDTAWDRSGHPTLGTIANGAATENISGEYPLTV